MSIFDIFGKEPSLKDQRRGSFTSSKQEGTRQFGSSPVAVFEPTSYDDVAKVIDALKAGKNAIVHMEKLKQETKMTSLNILSGAIYALGGGLYEIESNVYMFSPTGLELK